MKKRVLLAMSLFFAALCGTMAQSPGVVVSNKQGWHKIGQVSASLKMENESIVVLGADEFKSIKLKVKDASLNLIVLQVHYENGEVEDIPVKSEIKAGGETREIAIMQKDIRKVSFTYKTIANAGKDKADVELYGLK